MPNDADLIQAAKARLAAIDAERIELEVFLSTAEKLSTIHASVSDAVASLRTKVGANTPTPVSEIRKRAKAIIAALDRPVALGELYTFLSREGAVVGGKDPRSNLSAKLNGSPDLVSLPGKGWWLKNENGSLKVIEGGADLPGVAVARPVPVGLTPTPPTRFTGMEHPTANGSLHARKRPQLPDRSPG